MRKIRLLFVVLLISAALYIYEKNQPRHTFETDIQASSMYVFDFDAEKTLYEKNGHVPVAIASMTKVMTQYIVLNAIESGTIQWDTEYLPSEAVLQIANRPNFSNLYMEKGKTYTVMELFTASTVISANDATIALTEMVAGSEDNFVRLMNEQATYFGLENTEFFNATGLDGNSIGMDETNRASAHDMVIIAKNLLEKHPQILGFTSIRSFETASGTRRTTNRMLPGMPYGMAGVDGLKTGYTKEAQLCFIGTGIFHDRRIITVVTGVPVASGDAGDLRFELTRQLMEYGEAFLQ